MGSLEFLVHILWENHWVLLKFLYLDFGHLSLTPTCVLYLYKDETRDIRSNIALSLKEFPRAKPEGTPEGKGLYLTVYPESSPNTDTISLADAGSARGCSTITSVIH